ncbi:zinc-binding dehydrogenase [[Phormidium] sp. ETS-05]|uniref:zinc-binding dehydrogenase n=1 Tax=[Phormidium] sp. ETS-05 TaxID=222819 RepID=UPI0018EF207F|nr:zinc-binding dehydrogenase [[Phormidium] sp. ETS-05]
MKAIVIDKPGSLDNLYVKEMPEPQPQAGEVRVVVHAAGLNPADYKFIQRGFRTWQYPFIPGLDVAGIIDAVGPGVTEWQVGDAVYYHGNLSKPGGFAELAIAPAHAIAPAPQNLSLTEAAALPCAGFTAYQVLHRKLHINSDQTILIHGGAGAVGGFAVQLATIAGSFVISTCLSGDFEWVRQLGAQEVIDYSTEDVAARVREITTGRGVDAIVDTVSSHHATASLEMLAFGGGIACVAALPDFRKLQSFSRAISVHDVALGGAYVSGDIKAQKDLAQIGKELGALASAGKINPLLAEVIKLEEIPQALQRLTQGGVRGKIVAQIRNGGNV